MRLPRNGAPQAAERLAANPIDGRQCGRRLVRLRFVRALQLPAGRLVSARHALKREPCRCVMEQHVVARDPAANLSSAPADSPEELSQPVFAHLGVKGGNFEHRASVREHLNPSCCSRIHVQCDERRRLPGFTNAGRRASSVPTRLCAESMPDAQPYCLFTAGDDPTHSHSRSDGSVRHPRRGGAEPLY